MHAYTCLMLTWYASWSHHHKGSCKVSTPSNIKCEWDVYIGAPKMPFLKMQMCFLLVLKNGVLSIDIHSFCVRLG